MHRLFDLVRSTLQPPSYITYKGGKEEEKPYVITCGQVEEHTSLSYMFQQLCLNLKMDGITTTFLPPSNLDKREREIVTREISASPFNTPPPKKKQKLSRSREKENKAHCFSTLLLYTSSLCYVHVPGRYV